MASTPPDLFFRHASTLERRPGRARAVRLLASATLVAGGLGSILVGSPSGAASTDGPISGTVFGDADSNGSNDSESGIAGVTVTVTDGGGSDITAVSGSDGTFEVATTALAAGPYRVQFSGWDESLQPGPRGADNGSTVVFAGGGDVVDLGLVDPADFCGTNPTLAVTCFVAGTGPDNTQTIATFPYSAGTTETSGHEKAGPAGFDAPGETSVATFGDTGAVYGAGWHAPSASLYASAYAKRYAPLGPDGSGAIYMKRGSGISTFYSTGSSANRSPVGGDWFADPWFDEVGKVGWGDIDVVGNRLYAVNLENRSLYVFDIDAATGAMAGSGPVATVAVPAQASNAADSRPFALGHRHGTVYVGGVDSAQSGGTPAGWIRRFDPGTLSFGDLALGPFALDFPRGCSYVFIAPSNSQRCAGDWRSTWRAWGSPATSNDEVRFSGFLEVNSVLRFEVSPQPMLSDIEFDDDGDLIAGFRDRFGDQTGREIPAGLTPNPLFPDLGAVPLSLSSYSFGDVLRADRTGASSWTLESNGTSGGVTGTGGSAQGPGGGEFYDGDSSIYHRSNGGVGSTEGHDEVTMGGLYHLPGSDEVATTAYDVFGKWLTLGVKWLGNDGTDAPAGANSTDLTNRAYSLYVGGGGTAVPFGKANGLGDIEALCDTAPLELGNRVWYDADRDGIQDAGEAALPGVTVRLETPDSTVLATAVTDAAGRYWFGATDAPNAPSGDDPSWGGVDGGIAPGTSYVIRFDPSTATSTPPGVSVARLNITTTDASTNDSIDSDAVSTADGTTITLTTGVSGANDHTHDVGFVGADVLQATTTAVPATVPGSDVFDGTTLPTATVVEPTVKGTITIPGSGAISGGGTPLATTGGDNSMPAGAGVALLVSGLALLSASLRRRQPTRR